MPASRRFVDWIRAHPDRAFAAFAAVHALVWTALPTLLYPNLPLDLIEALMYGREWQLGYDKLPPLPWWLVEIAYRAVGHDFAYYLLAQLAVVAALALVFATARRLVDGASALASVLVVDGLHYVNYTSAKFNHDVTSCRSGRSPASRCTAPCAGDGGEIGCCSASPSECLCGPSTSSRCWSCP